MPSATQTTYRGRRLSPCLDCGRPCSGPRCADHAIQYSYATLHWTMIRTARLALDEWLCQLGHAGCTGEATSVHLDPSCEGDHLKATLESTTSACAHCHGVEDGARSSGREGGRPEPVAGHPLTHQPANSTFLPTGSEA
jgi:hypothetical protein